MKPSVPKSFLNQLKLVDDGLGVVWNAPIKRYEIWYTDKRNGLKKVVWTAEDDDGKPMPLDNRILGIIANRVDWDMLHYYPEPDEQYRIYCEKKAIRKKLSHAKREDDRLAWIDKNKKRIKEAHENAMRGIWYIPEQKPEPKIYIHK
jgi:hypothetical protein